ncbi:nitroreductase family protein [Phyllobacterium sp. K27]
MTSSLHEPLPKLWHNDLRSAALETMNHRRSVPPALLKAPAPNDQELADILAIASRVPDHGMLVPWRFVLVRDHQAEELLEELLRAHALEEEDEKARLAMASRLRAWLIGPPLIVFLIWCPKPTSNFPELDQLLCAGAVATTFLHAAYASGYGSIWLTGWPSVSERVRQIFGLATEERILGLFPVGTPIKWPADRARPDVKHLISTWGN